MLFFLFCSVSLLQSLGVYCSAISEDIDAFVNEIMKSLGKAKNSTDIKSFVCSENHRRCLNLFKMKSKYDRNLLILKTGEIKKLNQQRMSSYTNLFNGIYTSILTFKNQLDPQIKAYDTGLLKLKLSNVLDVIQNTIQELLEQQTAYHTIYLGILSNSIAQNFSDECVDAHFESIINNSQNEINQTEMKKALFEVEQVSLFAMLDELLYFETKL